MMLGGEQGDVRSLRIVYEDTTLMVIDKPSGMLAVPGRESMLLSGNALQGNINKGILVSRAEQWAETIKTAREIANARGVPTELEDALAKLNECSPQQQQNIPRKRVPFIRYLQRIFKAPDAPRFEAVFAFLQSLDTELHFPKLDAIPNHLVSAVDLAAEHTRCKLYTVHRLDMETSGILVLAKTEAACAELSRQFRERLVEKRYLALVEGLVPLSMDGSTIRLPLAPSSDPAQRPRQVVNEINGKACETWMRIISAEGHGSLVELTPITGRTHQLRVHLANVGFPIIGDTLYNTACPTSNPKQLCLHAMSIRFQHPETGNDVEFTCPCPFLKAECGFKRLLETQKSELEYPGHYQNLSKIKKV